MKIQTKILMVAIIALLLVFLGFLRSRVDKLKAENQRLLANQEQLLLEAEEQLQNYKVLDSLNAITIKALRLTADEYKASNIKNSQIIKALVTDKQDLQRIIDSKTVTVNELTAELKNITIKDTITQIIDTLKCFEYTSKWLDIKGCLDLAKNQVAIQSKSRESLKAIETVTYKRFLGFLWKTKQVKSRDLSIVSENPATTIINVDYSVIAE